MADYRKMYHVLCRAIDDVIDPLERIPLAIPYTKQLKKDVPDYTDTMTQQGYDPYQILYAKRKQTRQEFADRQKEDEISITSEVRVK